MGGQTNKFLKLLKRDTTKQTVNKLFILAPEFKRASFILKDLVERLLQPVEKRIPLPEVFNHPWISSS